MVLIPDLRSPKGFVNFSTHKPCESFKASQAIYATNAAAPNTPALSPKAGFNMDTSTRLLNMNSFNDDFPQIFLEKKTLLLVNEQFKRNSTERCHINLATTKKNDSQGSFDFWSVCNILSNYVSIIRYDNGFDIHNKFFFFPSYLILHQFYYRRQT